MSPRIVRHTALLLLLLLLPPPPPTDLPFDISWDWRRWNSHNKSFTRHTSHVTRHLWQLPAREMPKAQQVVGECA